jgi:hypothetical protein
MKGRTNSPSRRRNSELASAMAPSNLGDVHNTDALKSPAHPKATGGGGYGFEDSVTAFFLASMLAARTVLGPKAGRIRRATFQARSQHWFFDDVLLEFTGGNVRAAGVSIKSYRYVTGSGVPGDVARDGWSQILGEDSSPFEEGKDLMVVVTAPLAKSVRGDLNELTSWSTHQEDASVRLHVSQAGVGSATKRKLFESLRSPQDLAEKHSLRADDTSRLIRHLRFLEFDFQDVDSKDLSSALEICRSCLVSGDSDEAADLWRALCAIASEYRPEAGTLDLAGLVRELKGRFQLRDYPDYAEAWSRLRHWCRQAYLVVPDTLGGEVQIDRAEALTSLEAELQASCGVVLLAPSGFGKSVVVRRFVEQLGAGEEAVWLEASSPYLTPEEIRNYLGLSHSLDELLQGATCHRGYVAVDGVEQLVAPQDFRRLAHLVRGAILAGTNSTWRVLLVCQSEGWRRVRRELSKANLPIDEWKEVVLELPSSNQLEPVWKTFPPLRPLSLRSHLQQVLWRPKFLDMAARALRDGRAPDVQNWVGESSVAKWFWETEVQGGADPLARARALRRVAEVQADEMLPRVPTDRVAEVLPAVEQLVEARLLERTGERVRFAHDLYGDWSRLRVLLEGEAQLASYLKTRTTSPLWHRALRLYGIHLLEQRGRGAWKTAFEAFSDLGETGATVQDLLLESLVFAADPLTHLQALWSDFAAAGGPLLRRFLARFLSVATRSNPLRLAMTRGSDPARWAAAVAEDGVPEWSLWLPLWRFLDLRRAECIRLAPHELAAACECWLRKGGKGWLYRALATAIALDISDTALRHGFGYGKSGNEIGRSAFLAALAGYDDLPDEVRAFALRASGRVGEPEYTPDFVRGGQKWVHIRSLMDADTVPLPDPWPDGPVTARNDVFAEICLVDGGLVPVIASDPELAKEVLLALIIEPPRPRSSSERPILREEQFGLNHGHKWYPPFWSHLPLLCFFLLHPDHATDFVLRLVHFATDRWADRFRHGSHTAPSTTVWVEGEPRELTGDGNVYYWFRDGGAPADVVSALMALEKHLYGCLQPGCDIDPFLSQITSSMRSLAFAGVLSAVAARSRTLYASRLRFLLFEPLFYEWERVAPIKMEGAQMIAWSGASSESVRLAHEWHTMPHRGAGIPACGPGVFLGVPQLAGEFEEAKVRWREARERADAAGAQEYVDLLDGMISIYDRSNYEEVDLGDGGRALQYRPPQELEMRLAPAAEEAQRRLETSLFPRYCNEVLRGGTELTEEGCETFWFRLQRLEPLPEDYSIDLQDAQCGGAAVLLLRHPSWLLRYPERRKWCVARLLSTVEDPPPPGRYDTAESALETDWAHFCARALPALWAEERASDRYRRAVAALCRDFRYATVRLLVAAVFDVRSSLGDDYGRFWHLLRAWAAERWRQEGACRQRIRSLNENLSPEIEGDSAYFTSVLHGFLGGTLSPELPPLPAPVRPAAPDKPTTGSRRRRARPNVDKLVLACAAAGLPSLGTVVEGEARAEVIRAHAEVLDVLVGEIQAQEEWRGRPVEVYEAEDEILSMVARLVGQMRPDEAPERLFEKVLGIGCGAANHVRSFLAGWFFAGLHGTLSLDRFEAIWRQMVEWALHSPGWSSAGGWQAHELREMWWELMGLDPVYRHSWAEGHAGMVSRMKPLYEQWAEARLADRQSVQRLSAFCDTPAGRRLLPEALRWVREAAGERSDLWDDQDTANAVAELLTHALADEHRLVCHPVALGAFKDLLGRLCVRQNRIALGLREALAQPGGTGILMQPGE